MNESLLKLRDGAEVTYTVATNDPADAEVRVSRKTWPERVAHWNATFPKYPPIVHSHGWTYGVWYTGKGFTKNTLHGQYPPTFLKRALALWPDVPERRVLHVCAGTVQHGVRVDLSPTFRPSVLANAELLPFANGAFDVVLYDPPYDVKNAKIYGVAPKPPRWPHVMREMTRVLAPGGHIGILHWYYPSYSRKRLGIGLVGLFGVCVGFCSATRIFSVFEKVGASARAEPQARINGRFATQQLALEISA